VRLLKSKLNILLLSSLVLTGLFFIKPIPVIAITGRTDLDSQKAALKAGADYFLAKPYDLQFF
jgi:CheY-like chemotaxis protein